MGTDNELIVHGGGARALDAGEALVHRCERRWSRFLPTSELSRLNAAAGRPVRLDPHTFELISAAVSCWYLTGGLFDPTVEPAMRAAGYDRSFERASLVQTTPAPAPGCAGIVLDDALATVTLPEGVALDLGGIAKGHTADLVVEAMLAAGASGAVANLGGDVRVGGAPDGPAWSVGVADPFVHDARAVVIHCAAGAVATSSVVRRAWRGRHGTLHHVIDPARGAPAATDLAAVTVVAGTAAWAEVTAKTALIAGTRGAAQVVRAAGATGLVVDLDGRTTLLDGIEAFL